MLIIANPYAATVSDRLKNLVASALQGRRVDTGLMNGRHFTFASGIGLDASVVERVDRRPRLKARFGEYFFTYAALAAFNRRYLVNPPRMLLDLGDRSLEGVTLVVQNAD